MEQLNGESSIGAEAGGEGCERGRTRSGGRRQRPGHRQRLAASCPRWWSCEGRAELNPLLLALCPQRLRCPCAAAERGDGTGLPPKLHLQVVVLPPAQLTHSSFPRHGGGRGEMAAPANHPLPPPASTPSPRPLHPSPNPNSPLCHGGCSPPSRTARPRNARDAPRGRARRPGGVSGEGQGDVRPLRGAAGAQRDGCGTRPTPRGDGEGPEGQSGTSQPGSRPPPGPRETAGTARRQTQPCFTTANGSCSPRSPPPPTFGVCLKYLDVDFVSPPHLQLKHSFLFTGPLPVTGSQSREGAFISWGHLALIRTCCY